MDTKTHHHRSTIGDWQPEESRRPALSILQEQERGRLSWLLALRHERMAADSFSFFRGGAAFMAADLARQPNTGVMAQLCGDAHLLNFGFYASPERSLLFDIVDFDETYPGPFEWDLKRLLTSLVLVLQNYGSSRDDCKAYAERAARHYCNTIEQLATMPLMQMWGTRVDLEHVISTSRSRRFRRHLEQITAKAKERDTLHASARLCVEDPQGQLRFRHEPPELQRYEAIPADCRGDLSEAQWNLEMLSSYLASMPSQIQQLLSYYECRDWALKAVGVASVGTRCSISLWTGPQQEDVLILQSKQAVPSVLQADPNQCAWPHQGQRIVEGQRLMQTHSDAFLGWATSPRGDDVVFRHFRDWKCSVELEALGPKSCLEYAQLCSWVLAKAHARSSKASPIAHFIAANPNFAQSLATFACDYADTVNHDYQQFLIARSKGLIA